MNVLSNDRRLARWRRFFLSSPGVTSTEYALLLGALIGAVLLAAATIGLRLQGAGSDISSNLPSISSPDFVAGEANGPAVATR